MADATTHAPLRLTVRQLAAFAGRRGNLAGGNGGVRQAGTLDGIRAQQRLQRRRGDDYRAEVPVSANWRHSSGLQIELSGRIDGVQSAAGATPLLEEIKARYGGAKSLPEAALAEYRSQLQIYGHLFCTTLDVATVVLRLCVIDLADDREHRLEQQWDAGALSENCARLVDCYVEWYLAVMAHRAHRNRAAVDLPFPFPQMRPFQRELAAACYTALGGKTIALVQASTGAGKTVAALYGACKALGRERVDHVFFATAKGSGRLAARDCTRLLRSRGMVLTSLELGAREDTCRCRAAQDDTDAEACEYRLGFYDRLPAARLALLACEQHIDDDTLQVIAARYRVCPHALAGHVAPWLDLVIGDFNYLFDPAAGRDWTTGRDDRFGLLLDEAHNLVPRCRDMYSTTLDRQRLESLRARLPVAMRKPRRALRKLATTIAELDRGGQWHRLAAGARVADACPPQLLDCVLACLTAIPDGMEEPDDGLFPPAWQQELRQYLYTLATFANTVERADPGFCLLLVDGTDGRPQTAEWFCADPAPLIRGKLDTTAGAALFSATLQPLPNYARLLGVTDRYGALETPSPFPPGNQLVCIAGWIDTRLANRRRSLPQVLELIEQSVLARPGNYLVFLPSYEYLQACADALHERRPEWEILQQGAGMGPTDNAAWLQRFAASDTATVGFAVLGGSFAEGIDLPGEKLLGSIIVGPGLPWPSPRQMALERYLGARGEAGQELASCLPAMTRVSQAGGRVIRNATDTGVIILADFRFAREPFAGALPSHWQQRFCGNPQALAAQLRDFWGQVHDAPPRIIATGAREQRHAQ